MSRSTLPSATRAARARLWMRVPHRFHLATAAAATALTCLAAPAIAPAATQVTIKGAGFGHGVGMSQYGAKGYAEHGASYADILAHYYTGTQLAQLASDPDVRVLIASRSSVSFSGASAIGNRPLQADQTYGARLSGTSVVLTSPTGRDLVSFAGPVAVTGSGGAPVRIGGQTAAGVQDGSYRGAVELRPEGGKLLVINQLGLEDYVRGVVANESPASWPAQALRAQAVAARTYAITTNAGGADFSQWSDTRSQVYRGVAGETPTTDAAVADTAGRVVTYGGTPVTTFFFSTSGGQTEDNENSSLGLGGTPQPWLRSVDDPYDTSSPKHRWSLVLSSGAVQAKLGRLVKGSFRSIKVLQRGASPRIVRAQVIGTRGRTAVTGPQLRTALGLDDTWATFTTTTTTVQRARRAAVVRGGGAASVGPSAFGSTIQGTVSTARAGQTLVVQRRTARGTWREAAVTRTRAHGAYATLLPGPGTYRVRWHGVAGPGVVAK